MPYWERKNYKPYKMIKVLQPQLDTTIHEYIEIKIDDQEKRLVTDALRLKKNLKAIDKLTHNAISTEMV